MTSRVLHFAILYLLFTVCSGTGRGGESVFRMIYGDQAKYFDAEKIPKMKHKHAGMHKCCIVIETCCCCCCCCWLPDPFQGMGAWRKTMKPQKPGNSSGSGPEVIQRQRVAKE